MTEIAEYVLNRCITRTSQDDKPSLAQGIDMPDSAEQTNAVFQKQTSVTYDFQYLDDFAPASDNNKVNNDYLNFIDLNMTAFWSSVQYYYYKLGCMRSRIDLDTVQSYIIIPYCWYVLTVLSYVRCSYMC